MSMYSDLDLDEGHGFPSADDFLVAERQDGTGKAVYTLVGHARGDLIARFTGIVLPYRTQHTLQLNPNLHLLDLNFVGLLAHSCSPNVFVDMQECEVWALEDIPQHSMLTMDYAATEDVLYRQFRCLCGAAACREWITGRKELVSDEGLAYLRALERRRLRKTRGGLA